MIRVTYDSEHLRGELSCDCCEILYPLAGNVHIYADDTGAERTHPDARLKIAAHFRFDSNAHIPECPSLRKVESTTWEAVRADGGKVIARGRVEVQVHAHSKGPISVIQDEPPL